MAVIAEVGATLRSYRCGDRDVVDSFNPSEICPGAHGALLFPWPNRIKNGRYSYKGQSFQLDLSEPSTSSAIHGLLRWRPFDVIAREGNYVSLRTELHPTPGYPFDLSLESNYQLSRDGLEVFSTVTNLGSAIAPFGLGHHPYISFGPGATVDDGQVSMEANSYLSSDPTTGWIGEKAGCAQTDLDFSKGKHMRGVSLDHTFMDLARDQNGKGWIYVSGQDERVVALWMDEHYSYIQLFTSDTLEGERRRKAIAVEPMTCGPQAFRSGESLLELGPSEQASLSWGMKLL